MNSISGIGIGVIVPVENVINELAYTRVRPATAATASLGFPIISNYRPSHGLQAGAIARLNLDRSVEVWLERAPTVTLQKMLNCSL